MLRLKTAFQLGFPGLIAEGRDEFAADSGNGLQQKLREIAEGDGLLLGDAALRHEEKNLGEGAVDVGGGGEVAAERFERGERSFVHADFVDRRKLDFVAARKLLMPMTFAGGRDADPDRIEALEA